MRSNLTDPIKLAEITNQLTDTEIREIHDVLVNRFANEGPKHHATIVGWLPRSHTQDDATLSRPMVFQNIFIENPKEDEIFTMGGGKIGSAGPVVAITIISEVWISSVPKFRPVKLRPSEDPARDSGLIICTGSIDGRCINTLARTDIVDGKFEIVSRETSEDRPHTHLVSAWQGYVKSMGISEA
jgi:hypothetical protein